MATLLNKRNKIMTTKQLHFKWTVSRGRDTYGYNICTLLVDGEKVGKTCGGGYDMQGTVLGQWLTNEYQEQLVKLFANELDSLAYSNKEGTIQKGIETKFGTTQKYYGGYLHVDARGPKYYRVSLDGACGIESMKRIAEAIGITFKWNPESEKYKNHTYYTAIIN